MAVEILTTQYEQSEGELPKNIDIRQPDEVKGRMRLFLRFSKKGLMVPLMLLGATTGLVLYNNGITNPFEIEWSSVRPIATSSVPTFTPPTVIRPREIELPLYISEKSPPELLVLHQPIL